MYKESPFPTRILIVKTSSLGDIVQSLNVVDDLHQRFPMAKIDWAVEAAFAPIVAAHPYINRAICLNIKEKRNLISGFKSLRQEKYDLVFDLQGNCKSGVITFLARGKVKVGYDLKSVREWPNVLATHVRFFVSKQKNIRGFYSALIESYFKEGPKELKGVQFSIGEGEKEKIEGIIKQAGLKSKIMVCPGSKWKNKQLKTSTWIEFLQKIDATFLLVWGDENEKTICKEISSHLKSALLIDKLPLPTWQNLMGEVDLVIALDSSALHFCATTHTPSFSIFGPTSPAIFKPAGEKHSAIQGKCPYGRVFEKQCPVLRTCPTGACIKDLTAEELFAAYQSQCEILQR
jgi:heptosyltransferase-1